MAVSPRQVGLNISITAELIRFSCTTMSGVYKCWLKKIKIKIQTAIKQDKKYFVNIRGQNNRLVREDRKTQTTF